MLEVKKGRVYTNWSLGLHEPRDIYEDKDAKAVIISEKLEGVGKC